MADFDILKQNDMALKVAFDEIEKNFVRIKSAYEERLNQIMTAFEESQKNDAASLGEIAKTLANMYPPKE